MIRTASRDDDAGGVRQAAVAGLFYPADPRELADAIRELFDECDRPPAPGRAVAVVSPHAGYVYSGKTAAEGFHALGSGRYDVVVVISPSHREYFPGVSVYPGLAYATPLGELEVDAGLRRELASAGDWIAASPAGHRGEHAVEVQLPFVLSLFGRVPILPVVMGDQRRELCLRLADALSAHLAGRSALIVASTDLSHYHPAHIAHDLDGKFAALVERFDPEGLLAALEDGSTEACGGGPTVAALAAARALGASKIDIRHRSDSSDAGADPSSVVGYLSAVAVAP